MTRLILKVIRHGTGYRYFQITRDDIGNLKGKYIKEFSIQSENLPIGTKLSLFVPSPEDEENDPNYFDC